MADEFDVLDIVTEAVEGAGTGLIVYQGGSIKGEEWEHIVVNCLPFSELDYVGKMSVNVNIFTPQYKDGLPGMDRQKEVKRKVRSVLSNIPHPVGMYWSSKVLWSERLHEFKEGFDCVNIRLEIITEKN